MKLKRFKVELLPHWNQWRRRIRYYRIRDLRTGLLVRFSTRGGQATLSHVREMRESRASHWRGKRKAFLHAKYFEAKNPPIDLIDDG